MAETSTSFVVGEYVEPTPGGAALVERKSAQLEAFLPERDRYTQLPTNRHFDPRYVDLEWERLWKKTWLCAGRVSDLPSKGSWFKFEIGRESIIVVREDEGTINAFFNVCQHRGNRLVTDDFGKNRSFVCPYHGWRFDAKGACSHVTDREMFKPDALSGSLDIPQLRVETCGGFVWLNMDPDARPLSEYLGGIDGILASYPLETMEVGADVYVELDCNWKVILDAFSENYHVHITHPSVNPIIEDVHGQMDFYANGHTRRIVPIGNLTSRRKEQQVLHPLQRLLLGSVGIDPEKFAGGVRDVRSAVQRAKRAMTGPHGEAYSQLTDNQLTDDWATNIFPNTHLSMHAEGVLILRYLPHRSDPGKCILALTTISPPGVSFDFYFPRAQEHYDWGRPKRVQLRHDSPNVEKYIGQALHEDFRNTRETQLGLQSQGFDRMRLSEYEQPIMYQYSEIERYLNYD